MGDTANGKNGDEPDFEEVKIPVPWGHISGKFWGCKVIQPILAIHGWQDNASTFDKLAPLIVSRGHSLLCIDLPGHGFSSHYKEGHHYYVFWDGIHVVRRIVKHFRWSDVTIMGHSLGGGIAFLYAATFPSEVRQIIQFDIVTPSVPEPGKSINRIGQCIDKFLEYENLTPDNVPCYEYSEMIDIVQDAYGGGLSREGCEILMRRGMKPAPHKPGSFLFARDPRLKVAGLGLMTADQVLIFAQRITCEVLNVRGNPGMKFDFPELYNQVLDAMEKSARKVERHVLEGTHYIHLDKADQVAPIVLKFLA